MDRRQAWIEDENGSEMEMEMEMEVDRKRKSIDKEIDWGKKEP